MRADGNPSQPRDDAGGGGGGTVESSLPDPPDETDGAASAGQVAADLRRTEFLRPEGLLSVAAVAKRLGLSAATVYEAINGGKLRSVLFGSVRRVRPEDLAVYWHSLSASRPPSGDDWFTVADLVRAAGCSRAHAYRLIERGAVPFQIFGGTRYVRRSDLIAFRPGYMKNPKRA